MSSFESHCLSDWSRAVRDSSLKRLRLVPESLVNWRPTPEAMSFADIAQHLYAADLWLFAKLQTPDLAPIVGGAGLAGSVTSAGFLDLLARLEGSGQDRAALLGQLSPGKLSEAIEDARFGGLVTIWWVIVRGNLDHEVHHRGQIATYLRIAMAAPPRGACA